MKKSILGLMLLSSVSFADNVSFFGAEYIHVSGFGDSIDGYQLSARSVINGKASVGLSYIELSAYGVTSDAVTLMIDYAFGSFDDGSFYGGVGAVDGEGGADTGVTLGYSKRSGEGLDFDVSVAHIDGESALDVTLRGPIGDSGLGWNIGVSTDGDLSSQSAGINFKF